MRGAIEILNGFNQFTSFFVLNKYQSVTHVSTCIFQELFKNIVFISVALDTKMLWATLDLFSQTRLFSPCTQPYRFKKMFTKILEITITWNYNESARTKKTRGGAKRPPPNLFRVKIMSNCAGKILPSPPSCLLCNSV